MKEVLCAMFIILTCFQFSSAGNKILDMEYQPTRREWLELYIPRVIKERTDTWKYRISIRITISEKELIVTLSSAEGQKAIKQKVKNMYAFIVSSKIEAVLKQYPWAKDIKVFAQYI